MGFAYLLFNHLTKNFLIQRSNYTTKACLVLYESFISKIMLKCSCLVDFFATNLSIMYVYACALMHYIKIWKQNSIL